MKHYGDITKIHGYAVEPVDIICGGSPCQDLSVAGLRKGIRHEELGDDETTRSGLFIEQVRIIKEMRENARRMGRTDGAVGRYCIWENVPGAFSSNSGRDFQAVLSEFIRIAQPNAPDVPMPPKNKWPHAGCYYGVGADNLPFSLAYKLHDAQYWGVPQRRRRVCVLCDFSGYTAPEILFDPQYWRETEDSEPDEALTDSGGQRRPGQVCAQCEGVRGNFEEGRAPGQGVAAGTESGAGSAICGPDHVTALESCAEKPEEGKGMPCGNPWDTQSERVYHGDGAWHSLFSNNGGGQSRDAVLAFAQNQRDEVRILGDCTGGLSAEPGTHQQTYVATRATTEESPVSNPSE